MAPINQPLAEYVYVYSIALLPDVKEEEFEARMVTKILPEFHITRRNIAEFRMEHRLLKSDAGSRADQYLWQIRVLSVHAFGAESDALTYMDEQVRATLLAFGLPISLTILREIGVSTKGVAEKEP